MGLSDNTIKSLTKECVLLSINNYCSKERNYNFHPLNIVVPRLRTIRSVIGGLETSMGTTLWENLAKILAQNNGFTICDNQLLKPLASNDAITAKLEEIISHRVSQDNVYDAISSKKAIQELCKKYIDNPPSNWEEPPRGQGVDIWIRKKTKNYIFDTKTVQPNLGSLMGYLRQIHDWYYYFYSKYPNGNLSAQIAFPVNPHAPGLFFSNIIGRGLPLQNPEEAIDADSFWKFLTDNTKAYSIIIESFNEISDEASNIINQYIDSFQ